MALVRLDRKTLEQLQKVIEANFEGRDDLYAVANTLDDGLRQSICRQLAEHLADHAIHLQQIVTVSGYEPVEPEDCPAMAEDLFQFIHTNRGAEGVIEMAEKCELAVKNVYDEIIEETTDQQAEAILKQQRTNVELGENILKYL